MLKGIVTIEAVDIETGKVNRTHTQENFIFFTKYADLWIDTATLQRPMIVQLGQDIYPVYDKNRNFYGTNQRWNTGYIPEGTVRKKFFQKTDDSPAYWDFYSMFLPPAAVSIIPCISLSVLNSDNSTDTDGQWTWTALNLDPYCYQAPTEYLNVYYRLVMVEDDKNMSPDFIKNQFVLDIDRAENNVIFPNTDHKFYQFRIEQDTSKNGFVNFLSAWGSALATKEVTRPEREHNKLYNVQKTYTYPDANPNQYNQIIGHYLNTTIRGAGRNYKRLNSFDSTGSGLGTYIGINPLKITPDIGAGFTGIGNVFSSAKGSNSTMFDPAYFPTGTGRMQVSGVLSNPNKDPFLTTYQAEVQQTGKSWNDGTYRVYEYRAIRSGTHANIGLPLLPTVACVGGDEANSLSRSMQMMYKDVSRVHMSTSMVKYIEDRAFITWDKTGIMIYDIYHGKLEIYDANTTPALNVTDINDVKVDTIGNIWISCGDTGLWKLSSPDENTVTLTHIGVLPGSQQKCYAIDVDNFGNIFAVFWGTGPFWSRDQGQSWTNIPIDYAPFSEYEGGGFVSKWSYVARMICNPYRDATVGTSQFLFLMKETSPDYAASGGCWYDLQSQLTTGITNAAMKNSLYWVRNRRHNDNIAVSNDTNTWYFMENGNVLHWVPYQHNAATTSKTNTSNINGYGANICELEKTYDPVAGLVKEYAYIGTPIMSRQTQQSAPVVEIFDTNSKTVVSSYTVPGDQSDFASITNANMGAIRLGKNLYVSRGWFNPYFNNNTYIGYFVHNRFSFTKTHRQWASKQWGWDGAQWKENHPGNKTFHLDSQPFFRGALNKFTDGHQSTTSWVQGDTYTLTTFDGFYKDNSSTMAVRDTIYYKPTDLNTAFEPSVVTKIDASTDVGVMNATPIETQWNIDDLPDTTYSGGGVIANGDPSFSAVSYLSLFNVQQGILPTKGTINTVTGFPVIDNSVTLFGNSMVKVDGESGFLMDSNVSMALSTVFTLEGMFTPAETGKLMHLWDFRSPVANSAAFYITAEGRLAVNIGGQVYGNIGSFLFPGNQYYIAFTRNGSDWKAYLNGVLQFEFSNANNFPSESALNVFKRYQLTVNGWEGYIGWAGNIRYTKGVVRNVDTVPTAYYPITDNNYTGAQLVLAGNYNNGSITCKTKLVGDWEVIFRNITDDMLGTRRQRPKLAFGVSVQHFIESPTDISYRVCGRNFGTFVQTYGQSGINAPLGTTAIRMTKTDNHINVYYSTNGGASWTLAFGQIDDFNPVHHICFWQVQKDEAPMRTPSVEIVKNGSAIFSYVGTAPAATGYFNPKFLAMDVVTTNDIEIAIEGVPVTKKRSNWLDPALPLKGEVLAMQGGTIQFHEEDIGKIITGKLITIHD